MQLLDWGLGIASTVSAAVAIGMFIRQRKLEQANVRLQKTLMYGARIRQLRQKADQNISAVKIDTTFSIPRNGHNSTPEDFEEFVASKGGNIALESFSENPTTVINPKETNIITDNLNLDLPKNSLSTETNEIGKL